MRSTLARTPAPQVFGLALGLTLLAALPAVAGDATTEGERVAAMVADIRAGGTAMFSWLVDHAEAVQSEDGGEAGGAPDQIRWSDCPSVSYDDLAARLVPRYIEELPRLDPWGTAYQYCLAPDLTRESRVLGLRSAGSDGEFDSDEYHIGAFPLDEFHRDVVWLDGYFATWPAPPQK